MGLRERLISFLTFEEVRIQRRWDDITNYIRNDLANVWILKERFNELEHDLDRIMLVLDELERHYGLKEGDYQRELEDIRRFKVDLANKQSNEKWVARIKSDITDIIRDLELDKNLLLNPRMTRRKAIPAIAASAAGIALAPKILKGSPQQTVQLIPHLSPKNNRRPVRKQTRFIILHTTEGGSAGSLNRIHTYGLANYVLDVDGRVYICIEKNRVAKHAGRSMWNNLRNLDNYSIGIEIVGYYNKEITARQYIVLKGLIRQLQNTYNVPDERVLAHAMVAYGWNRWEKANVRGRRKDPMLLYRTNSLQKIGLSKKPRFDPDARAGRVKIIDRTLYKILYENLNIVPETTPRLGTNVITTGNTAWDIARDKYNDSSTIYEFPNGTRIAGNQISDWDGIPPGTKVFFSEEGKVEDFEGFKEISKDGRTAWAISGNEYNKSTTIYFLGDGRVRRGDQLKKTDFDNIKTGTKILIGYTYGGHVNRDRRPIEIVGDRWNHPSTFYRFPDGRVISGDEVDPRAIPRNTIVLFRN